MSLIGRLKSLAKKIVFKTLGPRVFYRTAILSSGLKMKVDVTDTLGIKLYNQKESPDFFEIELVRRFLKPGDTCIDVGANIGFYTLNMSAKVGGGGKVYSFEPAPETFKILAENITLNHLTNVTFSNQALTDQSGNVEFLVTLQSGLSGIRDTGRGTVVAKHTVPATTLDEYVGRNNINKVDFIKIDVEGFEGHVLRGGKNLLRTQTDLVIMVELDSKNFESLGFSLTDTFLLLAELGYKGWAIDRSNKSLNSLVSTDQRSVNFLFSKKNLLN